MAMTEAERSSATVAARAAQEADRVGDIGARDEAIRRLWVAVGYWLHPRQMTAAEYRGDVMTPRMIRMPVGRPVTWSRRWRAVEAWAEGKGER